MYAKNWTPPILAALILPGLANGHPAAAQTFYSTRSAFDAASTNLTTETFDGLVGTADFPQNYFAGVGYATASPSGITLDGVNFVGSSLQFGNETYILGLLNLGAFGAPQNAWEIDGSDALVGGRPTMVATLPSGITAVGTDIGVDIGAVPTAITIDADFALAGGPTYTDVLDLVPGQTQFVGFTSSSNISSVTFFDPNITGANLTSTPYAVYDNFSFGNAGAPAVPEPNTLPLLGLGLGGVALAARRRQA